MTPVENVLVIIQLLTMARTCIPKSKGAVLFSKTKNVCISRTIMLKYYAQYDYLFFETKADSVKASHIVLHDNGIRQKRPEEERAYLGSKAPSFWKVLGLSKFSTSLRCL